jgi:hypothetical protein
MARNEDMGDLPSLRPDSDEIKGAGKQSFSDNKGANAYADVDEGTLRRGSRDSSRPIAAPRPMQTGSPQVAANSNGLLWFLMLIMVVGLSGGGYWSYNKLTDVDLLLTVSRGELEHARKRIGELEALVVATDVNSNKSGTVIQTQVRLIDNRAKERNKFIDTEIDKLWGVTYRTNRPAIEENQKAIDNNTTTVKQHQESLKTQTERAQLQQSSITKQQAQVEKISQASQLAAQVLEDQLSQVKSLQEKIAKVLSQVAVQENTLADQNKTVLGQAQIFDQHAQDIADLKTSVQTVSQLVGGSSVGEDIDVLAKSLVELENKAKLLDDMEQNTNQLDDRVFVVEASIGSVDAFRRDTNQKLDQLEKQIRKLSYSE